MELIIDADKRNERKITTTRRENCSEDEVTPN